MTHKSAASETATFISAAQLRDRFGGVSDMWIVRRLAADPDFPRPVYIGTRRFWQVQSLVAWEHEQIRKALRR